MPGHERVQGAFAGVAEGGMAQVMGQADGFGQVLVDRQGAGDGAADLGDLQRMRQAGAVVVALIVDEDLGLVLQAAEGSGVQDAVAVALEGGAVVRLVFRVGTAPRVAALPGVVASICASSSSSWLRSRIIALSWRSNVA